MAFSNSDAIYASFVGSATTAAALPPVDSIPDATASRAERERSAGNTWKPSDADRINVVTPVLGDPEAPSAVLGRARRRNIVVSRREIVQS
jgi:hypothetical protein